ncbi:MAG: helix-turn-helix transcriptional regulator [Deltaproteobacteria bacterium]|nr:helix-turn-helix transcriptional regulator [Deltaproteobacteria bacterium]
MQPSSSVSDFLANPYGRYYCGRRHAVFAPKPTLIGLMSWGYPDVDDVRELLQLCEIGVQPRAVPHRFLADLRALEFIDPRTFTMFVDYTRRNRDALHTKLERQAQLRPEGIVGAVISGFSAVARLPYPERVFGDVDEALTWLGVEPGEGADLLQELDAIRSSAGATDPNVRRMREVLATTGCNSLDELAQRVHLSRRTCQRTFSEAGSNFRNELRMARLTRARDLLRQSDRNMTWIAAELGFSTVQHFAAAFRRDAGETPTAWRARHQAQNSG